MDVIILPRRRQNRQGSFLFCVNNQYYPIQWIALTNEEAGGNIISDRNSTHGVQLRTQSSFLLLLGFIPSGGVIFGRFF